jgi:hypothetical protein
MDFCRILKKKALSRADGSAGPSRGALATEKISKQNQ